MARKREFGERLRTLREAKRASDPTYSLRQFAQRAGLSATFLSKVETGEFNPPAPEKIKRMAQLLEVNADELLALAGRVDPELAEIIREQPRAMADFLRTARKIGLTEEDLARLTEKMKSGQV